MACMTAYVYVIPNLRLNKLLLLLLLLLPRGIFCSGLAKCSEREARVRAWRRLCATGGLDGRTAEFGLSLSSAVLD